MTFSFSGVRSSVSQARATDPAAGVNQATQQLSDLLDDDLFDQEFPVVKGEDLSEEERPVRSS